MSDEVREDDHEPQAPPPPPDEVAAVLCERFVSAEFVESHGQSVVYLDATDWSAAATLLRDQEQFTMCIDLTVVDHLTTAQRTTPSGVDQQRFEVVANFLSHVRNRRIRLIAQLAAEAPTIASITPLYSGANFAEREAFDLFGVIFEGHPDLTRIQMPDEWEGHPLRKDFAPARVPVTFKGDPSPR